MTALLLFAKQPNFANGSTRRIDSIRRSLVDAGYTVKDFEVDWPHSSRTRRAADVAMHLHIRRAVAAEKPTMVIACGLEFAIESRILKARAFVLDVCDSQNQLLSQASGQHKILRKYRRFLTSLSYKLISKNAKLLFVSEEDCHNDRDLFGSRTNFVLPNHVPNELRRGPVKADKLTNIGFVADLSYPPNLQGLDWYRRNVAPRIPKEVTLLIFGPVKPPELFANERYLGFVPDLNEVYAEFQVAISPDFSGAGVKNKVTEALWTGTPVLASPLGARGVENVNGIIIESEPQAWVDAIESWSVNGGLKSLSEQLLAKSHRTIFARKQDSFAKFLFEEGAPSS